MSNIVEYVLDLKGNLDEKLKQIGIENDRQLDTWSKVQKQVSEANSIMDNMGNTIGSMNQRIAALRAQREWIPAENKEAIRETNLEIKRLESEIRKLDSLNGGRLTTWFNQLKSSVPGLQALFNPLMGIAVGIRQVNRYIGESSRVYTAQAASETKLAQVMRNTIGAGRDQVQMVLDLTRAQEKLGVVSGRVMTAGAQELATYVTKTESVKQLVPVMNDMLAQQYGLNATQEQATTIATMLGRVMDGQVGALSRYGYRFDENQEKILRFGTEAERVATLVDVITDSVGGVNAALAQTPEGMLQQHANEAANLQARIGALVVRIRAFMLPIQQFFLRFGESIVGLFERIYGAAQRNRVAFTLIATSIGIVTAAFVIHTNQAKLTALWSGIVTIAKYKEAAAWWAAVKPMIIATAKIALIIAAVVALTGGIIYLVKHVTGWRETWNNAMEWMGLGINLFKNAVNLAWLNIKNFFISGFEEIERGWYKLQSLWNKDSARAGLEKLEAQRNERLKEIAAAKNKVDDIAGQMSAMSVWQLKGDGTTFREFIGGARDKPGVNAALQNFVGGASASLNNRDGVGSATNEAIATGGTRNTTVNISIGKMIESVMFNGSVRENVQEIERTFAESLYRVLGTAEVSAN